MQHQVAHIATQIDAARLMVYNSARMKDASQNVVKEAAMAKYYCGEVRITMLVLFYRQHVFTRGHSNLPVMKALILYRALVT